MNEDKTLDEITLHQDVINKDSGSPLYQIREKEIAIAGRVLGAKQKAETVIAEARRSAAEIVNKAETEAEAEAREYETNTTAEAEKKAEALRLGIVEEVTTIETTVADRVPAAVESVVQAVTRVE